MLSESATLIPLVGMQQLRSPSAATITVCKCSCGLGLNMHPSRDTRDRQTSVPIHVVHAGPLRRYSGDAQIEESLELCTAKYCFAGKQVGSTRFFPTEFPDWPRPTSSSG